MTATRHELYKMAVNYLDSILTIKQDGELPPSVRLERIEAMAERAKQAIHDAYSEKFC
jgi:hypothetical protein